MQISWKICIFAYTKTCVMDEQEREYLMENTRRMEEWEETPVPPSGRCSDMTPMEMQKLIDLLYKMQERNVAEISRLMEQLTLALEESKAAREEAKAAREETKAVQKDRDITQEKLDRMMSMFEKLSNGSELKAMQERAEKAEKALADLRAELMSFRGQTYGTKSQKSRKNGDKDDEGDTTSRDAGQEKDDMGGKDTVSALPSKATGEDTQGLDTWVESKYSSKRAYREGKKHHTLRADRKCIHPSDKNAIPQGWTLVREEKKYAYDKMTLIVEHEYTFFIVRDPEGQKHVMYLPKNKGEEKWVQKCGEDEKEVQPLAPVSDQITDGGGKPVMDCFPGTHASAGMMAQLVVDHFVNNIPYYRLERYFSDNGMHVTRQTLINWLYEGGNALKKLIPLLLDIAVTKDSVINCDETWCKVRVCGKYAKRYIWCLVNRELKIVIYFYKEGARSREALKSILEDREPQALQSDGYNVYLYLDDELVNTEHLCCMAHARAKFFYAWQANKEPEAEYILHIVQDLYKLETHYEKLRLTPDEIRKMRQGERTTDLMIQIRSVLDSLKSPGHPPVSEMLMKAVDYMDDFWEQLFAYRNDGRYSIDNTLAERFMRPISGERKNSLFYGSGVMANVSAVYRTLIATCRLMKISVTELINRRRHYFKKLNLSQYFGRVFRMLVAGCDNMASLLPMNMGLPVNNY